MKYQFVSVLQVTARDIADIGATDGSVAFTSNMYLAGLDGEDDLGTRRCDSAQPHCCVS
jgi:hypothetical protein